MFSSFERYRQTDRQTTAQRETGRRGMTLAEYVARRTRRRRPKRPRHLIAQLQCRPDPPLRPTVPMTTTHRTPRGGPRDGRTSKYTRRRTRLETSCERGEALWGVKQRFAGASLAPNLGRIGLPRGGPTAHPIRGPAAAAGDGVPILDRLRSP